MPGYDSIGLEVEALLKNRTFLAPTMRLRVFAEKYEELFVLMGKAENASQQMLCLRCMEKINQAINRTCEEMVKGCENIPVDTNPDKVKTYTETMPPLQWLKHLCRRYEAIADLVENSPNFNKNASVELYLTSLNQAMIKMYDRIAKNSQEHPVKEMDVAFLKEVFAGKDVDFSKLNIESKTETYVSKPPTNQ